MKQKKTVAQTMIPQEIRLIEQLRQHLRECGRNGAALGTLRAAGRLGVE